MKWEVLKKKLLFKTIPYLTWVKEKLRQAVGRAGMERKALRETDINTDNTDQKQQKQKQQQQQEQQHLQSAWKKTETKYKYKEECVGWFCVNIFHVVACSCLDEV